MKKYLLLLSLCFAFVSYSQEGAITGVVKDNAGEPIPGASVLIKKTEKGTITDFEGNYALNNIPYGDYQLELSYLGYKSITKDISVNSKTMNLDFELESSNSVLDEIVITSNKKSQKLTDVPATVNVIRRQDIEQFSGFNLGELASRQKGVDFVRTGVLGTGINIRGFNSAFNSKNLQVTDDRISTLIATGLPFGSFTTVIKEDVERVEILLGPNGTLYGPNAHNGLVSTITKNASKNEGTTIAVGGGSQNVLSTRLRHAQKLGDKFSYKLHFEKTSGTEFKYTDSVYTATGAHIEKGLDRDFDNLKYGTTLYFNPTKKSEITGYYGHSNNNNLGVTNAGRNQIKDWSIDVAQLKFVSKNFFANAYYTWSKTDDTYALNQRTQNYQSFIEAGFSEEESASRSFTEQWNSTYGIALPRGAVFKDASERLNSELQYNNNLKNFYYTVGAQYQLDKADSKGTYLLDQDGSIDVAQTGFYGQFEYKLDDSGWNFLLGARVDNHDLYGSNFIPKLAITKSVKNGTFRITYGEGVAVPSILNLKANLFGGVVLGNGEGFTLADGTKINKLEVESIKSYEIGYKGKLTDKLFLDANAYYNQSENFISPLRLISAESPVTHIGDQPIEDVIPGSTGAFVLTYSNFGKVDTYGVDLGLNYYFNDNLRAVLNYSYFDRDLDKNDLDNDGNLDGVVLETELPINTPNHKMSAGLHYNKNKFYGAIYGRYVQKYDFFSGINIAAETQDLDGDGINDVIENAQNGRTWNYGQLGGFTVDMNIGYNVNDKLSLGANVTNLFNADVREFVASPVMSTLISFELKYNINFFKKK